MTHFFIAADNLPHSEDECPKVAPTGVLNVEQLLRIAKSIGFEYDGVAFICSVEALAVARQWPNYPYFSHLFYFPATVLNSPIRRYTMLDGEWVHITDSSSMDYQLAPFEDVMIINPNDMQAEKAVFRFRRVIQMEIPDEEFAEQ